MYYGFNSITLSCSTFHTILKMECDFISRAAAICFLVFRHLLFPHSSNALYATFSFSSQWLLILRINLFAVVVCLLLSSWHSYLSDILFIVFVFTLSMWFRVHFYYMYVLYALLYCFIYAINAWLIRFCIISIVALDYRCITVWVLFHTHIHTPLRVRRLFDWARARVCHSNTIRASK